MSRRAAFWRLGGIAALLVGVGMEYRAWTDPHRLTYSGNSNTTIDAVWSPDGTRIASAGWLDGGTVQIWDPTTGKTLQTCKIEHPVQGIVPLEVVWSSNGKYVQAYVGWDHNTILDAGSHIVEMVQVWDVATGQRVRSIPITKPTITVDAQGDINDDTFLKQRWALNERYIAASKLLKDLPYKQTGEIEIWDIATGSEVAVLGVQSQSSVAPVFDLTWAPDNETLAINWYTWDAANAKGKDYLTIEIWNIATRNKIATLDDSSLGPFDQWQKIFWAPDSRTFALVSEADRGVNYEVWNALSGKRLQTFKPRSYQSFITWSPDGKFLALGTEVFDVKTGNKITTYPLQGTLDWLVWSPDGTRVVLVDAIHYGKFFSPTGRTLYILDALNGKQIAKYPGEGLFGNSGTTGRPIWSPDGKYIMVVGKDTDIWIWRGV